MYDNKFGILGGKQSGWKQNTLLEANNTEVNVTEDGENLKMDREPAESKLVYFFMTLTNQQLAQKYHVVER